MRRGGGVMGGVADNPPSEMATAAVGTHPTGLHSCILNIMTTKGRVSSINANCTILQYAATIVVARYQLCLSVYHLGNKEFFKIFLCGCSSNEFIEW